MIFINPNKYRDISAAASLNFLTAFPILFSSRLVKFQGCHSLSNSLSLISGLVSDLGVSPVLASVSWPQWSGAGPVPQLVQRFDQRIGKHNDDQIFCRQYLIPKAIGQRGIVQTKQQGVALVQTKPTRLLADRHSNEDFS